MTSNIPEEKSAEAVRPEVSPGAIVRAARERARQTVDELAAATKLSRNQIEALEKDDFGSLLEPVYVRGYYRKCAKILGLPETELLAAYENRVAPKRAEPPAKLRLASGSELGSENRLPVPMAVVAAVAAVIFLVFLWNMVRAPDEARPSVPVPVTSPAPAVTTPSAAPVVSPEALPASAPALAEMPAAPATAEAPVAVPVTPAPAPVSVPKPETTLTPPVVSAPAATSTRQPERTPRAVESPKPAEKKTDTSSASSSSGAALTLSFTITSWARVDDSKGKTLLNSLMKAGDKRIFRGSPPYKIFLGNAPGVKVEYDGAVVDFSSAISDNLTARITVPAGDE